MRLALATYEAVKYACMTFHYAKAVPAAVCSFSVFNSKNEWCGCIVYSHGANNNLGKKYKLRQGEVCELVRVALNGQQESTSKAVSISLKLLSKLNPLLKLVISYADCDQEHIGTIYQATNWTYEGLTNAGKSATPRIRVNGKAMHFRSIHSKGWKANIEWMRANVDPKAEFVPTLGKHKYLYPLTPDMQKLCKVLAKPYLKKQTCGNSLTVECQAHQSEDGVRIDLAAQKM